VIPRSGIIFKAKITPYMIKGIIEPKINLFQPIVLYRFSHLSVSNLESS